MLLTIDAGNTQTVVGLFRDSQLVDHWRIATVAERTSDELALMVQQFLGFHGFSFENAITGVASTTHRYVMAAHGKVRVLDTRKTLPGLRAVQRAAVRAGGGFNHRDSLSDAVLIKDNHLAANSLAKSVERARSCWPGRLVEVECDSLDQVIEARDAAVDRVLLDNMTSEQVREAVARLEGVVEVEVSGGVTLETVSAYAESGADFVSVGALTHSVPVFDIGLDMM